ncbi:MAG: large subunit ribosomal protein [Beijerinckiaceae bacterium]|nr:MAG: large subunit ribosomal protein [Beijerinckiaceae bacterium]
MILSPAGFPREPNRRVSGEDGCKHLLQSEI